MKHMLKHYNHLKDIIEKLINNTVREISLSFHYYQQPTWGAFIVHVFCPNLNWCSI